MPQFVVLLRGVNVGKANRLPMAEFRALLENLGYTGVRTLLNSGNAVFASSSRSATALATAIHAALLERLGLDLAVIVKSAADWAAVLAGNSLAAPGSDPARLLVAVTQTADSLKQLAGAEGLTTSGERFLLGQHAAYLQCAGGILDSKAGSALLGKPGSSVTTRNWTTVLKLQDLLNSPRDG